MNSRVKYMAKAFVLLSILFISFAATAQSFTHYDTLRGSLGPGRTWWDVQKYDLSVKVNPDTKTIQGKNAITFSIVKPGKHRYMQIDLQKPMEIERIEYAQNKYGALPFRREGNVYFIDFGEREFTTSTGKADFHTLIVHYKGKPRAAVNAPWDGGWIWASDEKGRPWITVACQGLGASVWFPCKDHQSDEPQYGATLSINVPQPLVAVGNGRLKSTKQLADSTSTWTWEVTNPINNYNIVPYIGYYVNWQETYPGLKGNLDCSYWVLDYNIDKAKKQFGRDVKPMLSCFEKWFGPYPFYEDSYKMVESSHLGMEHQSAVAYGNKYRDGYLGTDLSGSGWGKKWDYIIIHESGHEWFANNITTNDIADMWVHEGFTDYSEVLFVECQYGKKAADEYCQGLRKTIQNDRPIIGSYGVNKEGSGDMYAKGANLIHTIRQIIGDDEKFKAILTGMNKEFYHSTVTSAKVEAYIIKESGKKLDKVFDQYLRATTIPVLEYKITGKTVSARWTNCIPGFDMPVKVIVGNKSHWIHPGIAWKAVTIPGFTGTTLNVDPNFYITVKKVAK